MKGSPALEVVIDLPFLASEVNDAHRQVSFHAKGMLLEAKRAGDALLAAKAKVRHGKFEGWVRGQTRCSIQTARRYMQVSKLAQAKTLNLESFDGGMVAFLEAHAKPRVLPPQATPSFTEKDAERVLNIAARVESGEGAEKAVAAEKAGSAFVWLRPIHVLLTLIEREAFEPVRALL
jgi:hypothetical protein